MSNPISRRTLLRTGAAGAAAVTLAACGKSKSSAGDTTTTTAPPQPGDVAIIRTGAALELLIVDLYDKAAQSKVLTTAAIAAATKQFAGNHKEHLDLFQTEAVKMGAAKVSAPHQELAAQLESRVSGVHDEKAVAGLLLDIEKLAAATYQGDVGRFSAPYLRLNQVVMSVGAVAARQAALLATLLGQPAVPAALQRPDGGLAPGSGL